MSAPMYGELYKQILATKASMRDTAKASMAIAWDQDRASFYAKVELTIETAVAQILKQTDDQVMFDTKQAVREYLYLVVDKAVADDSSRVMEATLKSTENRSKRMAIQAYLLQTKCYSKQHSDQVVCPVCNLRWDVNDSDPPHCNLARKATTEHH